MLSWLKKIGPDLLVALIGLAGVLLLGWWSAHLQAPVRELTHEERITRTCRSSLPPSRLPDLNHPARIRLGNRILTPPPDWQDEIRHWIEVFRSPRHRSRLRGYFERVGRYRGLIEEFFPSAGVPLDIQFLAVIESGGNPEAVSRARAVGVWQFMSYTGREWGLEVSTYHDQRRDPVASTRAAARYLARLHQQFGNWPLALAAYNGGPNRLRRLIHRHGASDPWQLLASPRLPRETRAYVPKFLAALLIGRQPQRYGMGRLWPDPPRSYQTVTVPPASRLSLVAQTAGISLRRLKAYNPHFPRSLATPQDSAHIRLPPEAFQRFQQRYAQIVDSLPAPFVVHRVQPRETLSRIALRYGTTVQKLMAINEAPEDPRHLQAGQRLQVPTAELR